MPESDGNGVDNLKVSLCPAAFYVVNKWYKWKVLQEVKNGCGFLDAFGEEVSFVGQEKELHFLESQARSEVHRGI